MRAYVITFGRYTIPFIYLMQLHYMLLHVKRLTYILLQYLNYKSKKQFSNIKSCTVYIPRDLYNLIFLGQILLWARIVLEPVRV